MTDPILTEQQLLGFEQEAKEEDDFTGEIGAKGLLCRHIRWLESQLPITTC